MDSDDHSRVIIHVDMDCYYAQVEMNKNPKLRDIPMGVYQKHLVVTANQLARQLGIAKGDTVKEALEKYPALFLVNGEDLYNYRKVSYKVTELMQRFAPKVERLGLDENFLDVTDAVAVRQGSEGQGWGEGDIPGEVFGSSGGEQCQCGCQKRLAAGARLAAEIRKVLKAELGLTSCAGVAHNKLLAKIAGKIHKPDNQTVVFPNSSLELIMSLKTPANIHGIGRATSDQLTALGVETIDQLQSSTDLDQAFGAEKARALRNLSYGIDNSPVKPSGKPQSIGIEDSFCARSISIEDDIKNNLAKLLTRLLIMVNEDGRIPKTIKLTVRRFDKDTRISNRETRQCNINFRDKEDRILNAVMHLFAKAVDTTQPYHITLLGLAFTKFQEVPRNSIASFLTRNIEVQSVTSIESLVASPPAPAKEPACEPSTSKEVGDSGTPNTSPLPSPKKLKLGLIATKRGRCFDNFDECASPSKLRVADLCLGSSDKDSPVVCPPDADESVFRELPWELQREIWEEHRRKVRERGCGRQVTKPKPNTLLNYFIRNNS